MGTWSLIEVLGSPTWALEVLGGKSNKKGENPATASHSQPNQVAPLARVGHPKAINLPMGPS